MRETILKAIEKNSRIDLHELAIMLGEEEINVVNEVAAMEKQILFEDHKVYFYP